MAVTVISAECTKRMKPIKTSSLPVRESRVAGHTWLGRDHIFSGR